MKFHTTITCPASLSVRDADSVTEMIRGQGYPGRDGWKRRDDMLVWEAEFEGDTLDEISSRYTETRDEIDTMFGYGFFTWTANPDDPIEHAQRTARDVLEWEKHFDEIELPDDIRNALKVIAGQAQS